jgi:hypothetical protein
MTNGTPCDCGGCSAASLVMVQRPGRRTGTSGVLTFCGAHYREHEPVLLALGWTVIADGRADLIRSEHERRNTK